MKDCNISFSEGSEIVRTLSKPHATDHGSSCSSILCKFETQLLIGFRVSVCQYSPTFPNNVLRLVLHIFPNLESFESNMPSNWLSHMVQPIKVVLLRNLKNAWRKLQKLPLTMAGDYQPRSG